MQNCKSKKKKKKKTEVTGGILSGQELETILQTSHKNNYTGKVDFPDRKPFPYETPTELRGLDEIYNRKGENLQKLLLMDRVKDIADLITGVIKEHEETYRIKFDITKRLNTNWADNSVTWGDVFIRQYQQLNAADNVIKKGNLDLNSPAYKYLLLMEEYLDFQFQKYSSDNPLLVPALIKILCVNATGGEKSKSILSRINKEYLSPYMRAVKNVRFSVVGDLIIYPGPSEWATSRKESKFRRLSESMASAIGQLPHTIAEMNILNSQFYGIIQNYAIHQWDNKNLGWEPETFVDFGVGSKPEKTEIAIRETLRWRDEHNIKGKLKVVVIDVNKSAAQEGMNYLKKAFEGEEIEFQSVVSTFDNLPYIWNDIEFIKKTKSSKNIIGAYLGNTAFNGHSPEENLEYLGKLELGLKVVGVHGMPIDAAEGEALRNVYIKQYRSVGVYNMAQLLLKCCGKKPMPEIYEKDGKITLRLDTDEYVDLEYLYEGNVIDVYMPTQKSTNRKLPVYIPIWKIDEWRGQLDIIPSNFDLPEGLSLLTGGLASIKPYVVPENWEDARDQMNEIFNNCNLNIKSRYTNDAGWYNPKAENEVPKFTIDKPEDLHAMYLPKGAFNLIACYG